MSKPTNNTTRSLQTAKDQRNARIFIFGVLALVVAHTLYMNAMGFTPLNHSNCAIYKSVPKWFFQLYESFGELFVVVILGILAGVLLEKYFFKIKRFYPKNQVLAFVYGAILPICSCGVVPLIESMQKKTSLKVIVTFIIATPLLNPYIVSVSFAVLGFKYGMLRIVFSFLTALISGWVVDAAAKMFKLDGIGDYKACVTDCDPVLDRDPFVKTMKMTRKILPYILIAGTLSFVFALVNPKQYLESFNFSAEPWATLLLTIVGIPLYVCNGSDVLFLKPLMEYTDLSMGAAIAFSLSASALCISSIVMLAKYLGGKLTTVLTATIFVLMLVFSFLINLFL
jgi:uncharacterized membrane protein YraQ (UPF0718 family)